MAGYIYYNLTANESEGQVVLGWTFLGLGWFFLGPFIAYFISLAMLSIIGSILLLRKSKYGLFISLAALVMWTVTLSHITFGWLLLPISFVYNAMSFVAGTSLMVSTAIMYVLLVKACMRGS